MTETICGESGLRSTRTSAHLCSGQGYVVPPVTQLCCPVDWAPSASVRLAKAAHDSPWSAPSTLSTPQIIASISAGLFDCAMRR